MNEVECFDVIKDFLYRLSQTYGIDLNACRIAFFVKNESLCFSIINSEKNRIKLNDSRLLFVDYETKQIKNNYGFDFLKFIKAYFNNWETEFLSLDLESQLDFLTVAINEIYLDKATIPTLLL